MNRTPIVRRDVLRSTLSTLASSDNGGISTPTLQALASCDLDTQVDQIEVRPQYLNGEELSKIWSALQARYRPSLAYKVSMVLIRVIDQRIEGEMAAISAEAWEQINHRALGVALARVRTALERHVRGERSVFEPPVESEADDGGNRSALATLCAAFRLSPFERDLLVLCASALMQTTIEARDADPPRQIAAPIHYLSGEAPPVRDDCQRRAASGEKWGARWREGAALAPRSSSLTSRLRRRPQSSESQSRGPAPAHHCDAPGVLSACRSRQKQA
jgi:hypothetical protein